MERLTLVSKQAAACFFYLLLIKYFKCHQYTSLVSKTSQKTTLSRRVAFIPRGHRAEMPGPALALKNCVAQLQQQPHPTICFLLCQEITRIRALSSQEEHKVKQCQQERNTVAPDSMWSLSEETYLSISTIHSLQTRLFSDMTPCSSCICMPTNFKGMDTALAVYCAYVPISHLYLFSTETFSE